MIQPLESSKLVRLEAWGEPITNRPEGRESIESNGFKGVVALEAHMLHESILVLEQTAFWRDINPKTINMLFKSVDASGAKEL
jgi:hypothetical protein